MKKFKKIMSALMSVSLIAASVSALSANAFGVEMQKRTVVNIVGEDINYSEILDDNTIMTFNNKTVYGDENKNNMSITYYTNDYAEDYVYYFNYFSVIFKLDENSSIDDFTLDYDDIEFSYKEVGENIYQISAENNNAFHFGFEYETACKIENIIADNPMVEDTDIVWGYEHKNSEVSKPTARITLKDDVSLQKEDFSFLQESGFTLADESENLQSFEILYNGERIYDWNLKTQAMCLILQNIGGIAAINNDFEREALARVDGYSMLDGYSITGVYDCILPSNLSVTLVGDANNDNELGISDVVAISAYIGNPEVNALSEQAIINGDVHNTGDGLTANDALLIQQYLAGNIENF